MPRIAVVDLSHHNVIPKGLAEAKAAGIVGVIHKATEGLTNSDKKYNARRILASNVGLLWGAYHFMRAGSVERQVDFFMETAKPDAETLMACDYEDDAIPVSALVEFMQSLEKILGRLPVLYCGHILKAKLGSKANPALSKYRLWLAQYGKVAHPPAGWEKTWLWQYSDGASGPSPHVVPGINSPVDCDNFDGTDEQLREEWAG